MCHQIYLLQYVVVILAVLETGSGGSGIYNKMLE
jgi:hypothetical protein